MDYNRWNGSLAELREYFGETNPLPALCPLDAAPCERAGLKSSCERRAA